MKRNTCRSSGWVAGSLATAMLVMGTASMAAAAGFTAYNDLAWGTGQLETNITKYTSPDGGSGLPSTGLLKDFATGVDTGVTLAVTGGSYLGAPQATQGADPTTGDAFMIFDGKVSGQGALSYVDAVGSSLVLTFSGLNPNRTYDLAYFAHRNANGWDRASLVTISGTAGRTNTSSVATDNPSEPGGVIFSGPGDSSTRLPADNDNGYVARWSEVSPGSDGIVVLTISFDGSAGEQYKGKYGSAVRLIESSGSVGHDLDGDGKADLVWRHTNGNAAVWLLNGTAVPSSMGSLGGVSSAWQVAGVGDTDADGKADIIWRNTTSGAVAVWLMNGVTMTSAGFPGTASTAWQIQGVGDLNGDGKADLVWRHTNGSAAVWLLNGTAAPSSMGSLGVVSSAYQISGVGDTDADGKADIIWRNTTSGLVAVWLMDGVTMTSAGFPGTASTVWSIQGVGDLNGDDKADLVWRHTNGSAAVWLLNGTAAPSSTGSLGVVSSAWEIRQVGDTDADGNADIIWRNTTSGAVSVWLMNGTTLTSAGFPGSASTSWEIQP
ncbi:VCBS repeat-containing protein [Nitrospira sp. MA-1]|nr:VCBS repeat-containing protein [Nitrospira sp. MA-1]